jgi:hypothetical protein
MPGLGWGLFLVTSPASAQGTLLLPASPFAGSKCNDCVEDALGVVSNTLQISTTLCTGMLMCRVLLTML